MGVLKILDELKKQIADLQNEVDSLTAQIQQEKQEKEQLQQQVNGLKKQQNETNATISDLNNQIKDKDNKITDLTKEKESLESQINTLKSKQATGNATTSQVLAGATFSTSEGVGLTGTMVNHSAITTAVSVSSDESNVYLRTTQGAYLTNASSNYPEICASISDINNITGYKYTQSQYDSNYTSGYNAGKYYVFLSKLHQLIVDISMVVAQLLIPHLNLGFLEQLLARALLTFITGSYASGNVSVSYSSSAVTIYRDTSQEGTLYFQITVFYI